MGKDLIEFKQETMQEKRKRYNNRTILHCDVNNFFASVECISRPELKDKPVAVSGNPETRTGIILAKNEIAKKFGVKTGDAIFEAKQKCPDLICLPPHHSLYEKISKQIIEIYYDYTDTVESFGIDECWLDVTSSTKLLGTGKEIADKIRQRVFDEIGVTISVGVSFSKLFAKLGSDYKKPFATTEISKDNYKEIVYPLPVDSVIGIGRRSIIKLEKMNVKTLGDYVKLPDSELKLKFGINGVLLKQKLLGYDFDEVIDNNLKPEVKSVGNGTTTIVDIISRDETSSLIQFLSEKISKRLEEKKLAGQTIHISIKTSDFKHFSRSESYFELLQTQEDISKHAMSLLDSFWKYDTKIRAIRISVSNLKCLDSPTQISFFEENKTKNIEKTINEIKRKYGKNIIELGSVLKSNFINLNKDD